MSLPVLVVGAGPAGLVAALTLVKNNVPVRIIAKEQQYRLGQRGAGIQPRSLEVLHFLRVSEIRDHAAPFPLAQLHDPGSIEPRKTFDISPYTEPTPAIPYYNPQALGQPTLEGILRSHLARYGCTVELGTQLVSFVQDDTCVHAKLKHRADDGSEREEDVQAAYLIGADGAKGVTRKLLGLTFLGSSRDEHFIVCDIQLDVENFDRNYWHFFGGYGLVSLRPTDELGTNGYQVLMTDAARDLTHLVHDEELLLAYIKETIGLRDDDKPAKVLWVSDFRPNIRMVNKFGEGRVFIAGDAAHVHSPTGGQGLNSSVQDAFNIAWKLSLVYKGLSPASLLETYTDERIPVIAEMLDVTTNLLQRVVEPGPNDKKERDPESTFERAWTRGKHLFMLGVNYRTSPIVIDEFFSIPSSQVHSSYRSPEDGVLRAGDRAPDAPDLMPVTSTARTSSGESGARLFDIFAPTHHTVLTFVPSPSVPVVRQVLSVLEELGKKTSKKLVKHMVILPPGSEGAKDTPAKVDQGKGGGGSMKFDDEMFVDRAGHAHSAYVVDQSDEKVIVVRPDGVVGAVVRGGEGVGRYFGKIFGDACTDVQ